MDPKPVRLLHLLLSACALAALLAGGGCPPPTGAPSPMEQSRLHNGRGVAHMERYDYASAAQEFEAALALRKDYLPALINLGLARFYMGGDSLQQAEEALRAAYEQAPDHPTLLYALSLTLLQQGSVESAEEAAGHLTRLIEIDPDCEYVHCQLGMALNRLERSEEAMAAFRRALEINPDNATAHWRLGQLLLATGQREEGLEHLKIHERLQESPQAATLGTKYGEVGPYGLAIPSGPPVELAAALPLTLSFEDVTEEVGLTPAPTSEAGAAPWAGPMSYARLAGGAAFLDFNDDGRLDIALVSPAARKVLVYRQDVSGKFEPLADEALPEVQGRPMGVVVGDYDAGLGDTEEADAAAPGAEGEEEAPERWPDLFVYGYQCNSLWRNVEGERFQDVTDEAGLARADFSLGAAFVDYDHEGDIDLYVATGQDAAESFDGVLPLGRVPTPHALYQNAGGTFSNVAEQAGLVTDVRGRSWGAACFDADRDRAVDLLLMTDSGPRLHRNMWDGTFEDVTADSGLDEAGLAAGALVADLDGKEGLDIFLPPWDGSPARLYLDQGAGQYEQADLPEMATAQGLDYGWGGAAADFDNDGLTDIFFVVSTAPEADSGLGACVLLRQTAEGWVDVTQQVGLDAVRADSLRGVAAGDYDRDGDVDLLLGSCHGAPRLLRNDCPPDRGWVQVQLTGLHSNLAGVGAQVELMAPGMQQYQVLQSATGYMGSSAAPLHFGLGRAEQADWIRVVWPSGIVQSELDTPVRQVATLQELDRKPTSCPILYAYDGRDYEFVTDLLGNAIIGYLLARGQYCPWDPDEYVRIEGSQLAPKDGRLLLEIADQLEEVIFLDQVKLLYVDHPRNVQVFSSDVLKCAPPYPEFELYAIEEVRPPERAEDTKGYDVRGLLAKADRKYLADFRMLSGLDGYATDHSLTLHLGDLAGAKRVWLLVEGFLEYAHSSSNLAASQRGLESTPPLLEVGDGRGGWRTVSDDMGMVAGLTKRIAIELTPALKASDPRVRISTNMPFFMDSLQVGLARQAPPLSPREAPLAAVDYHWLGYPEPTYPGGVEPVRYDYSRRRPHAPWQTPRGMYTRPGDVTELLKRTDDQFLIMRHGYSARLEFDASGLPAPTEGMARTYFLYAYGVGKDMDMNGAFANTIAPLPHRGMSAYQPGAELSYPWTAPLARSALRHQTLDQAGPAGAPAVCEWSWGD
ncbi:MAG: FG-GAP-like repeat-containing protein [Armatimonadota bacterium]